MVKENYFQITNRIILDFLVLLEMAKRTILGLKKNHKRIEVSRKENTITGGIEAGY